MIERSITPLAECRYAFLFIPDTKFNPEGVFRIEIIFDPAENADHQSFLTFIKEKWEATKGKNKPWKNEIIEETGETTGRFIIKFKSKYAVNVFDALKNKIEFDSNKIGNGSKVRVSFSMQKYTQREGGLALYLNAVQVVNLVEYSGGSAEDFGFDEVDGYNSMENVEKVFDEKFNSPEDKDEEKQLPEDDLPF